MDVYFYNAGDNSLIGMDNVPNGTYASCTWSSLQYGTTYYWYAVANDTEFETSSQTWSFKTKSSSSQPPPPPPPPPPLKQEPIAHILGPVIEYTNETFYLSAHYLPLLLHDYERFCGWIFQCC